MYQAALMSVCKGFGQSSSPPVLAGVFGVMTSSCTGWVTGPWDDGRSSSYPRVGYRTPCSVLGLALSRVGHEAQPRHVVGLGRSPPRPRPDPVQPVCWPIVDSKPQAGSTTRPIAHKKAAISRAIAATATGAFFPAAISRR